MPRKPFFEPTTAPVAVLDLELRKVNVFLTETGRFYAKGPEGERLESKNLDGLRTALKEAIRKNTPLNYFVVTVSGDHEFDIYDYDDTSGESEEGTKAENATPEPLEFTKRQIIGPSRGGYVDAVDEEGHNRERIYTGRRHDILRPLTQEDEERLRVLWRVAWLAKRDYQVFLRTLTIEDVEADLRKLVAAKIAEDPK